MRKTLQVFKGVIVAILSWLFYAVQNSGNDLITAARRNITDLGGTPPRWLAVQNEPTIIKWLFSIILLGCILLLILSWIEFVVFGLIRWWRTVRDIRKIIDHIPTEIIPKDGNWNQAAVNRRLQKFVGRSAKLRINIQKVSPTEKGRYAMIPRVFGPRYTDERTKLDVQLYGYFDGASADQLVRISQYGPNEQMTLLGKISRSDIAHYEDGPWSLVIDLHNCSTL